MSDQIAALAEPFAVGFHVLSRSELRLGDTALVIGAGPIGIIIAITAKAAGANVSKILSINDDCIFSYMFLCILLNSDGVIPSWTLKMLQK